MSTLAASVPVDPQQPEEMNAILAEIEHQADHWDTPEHGWLGHIIAEALRAAVDVTMAGGLQCQHRVARE